MRLRAKFNPARDERNRPVASIWRSRFRWTLPVDPGPAQPLYSGAYETRFTLGTDGAITACTDTSKGPLVVDEGICGFLRAQPVARRVALRGNSTGPVTIVLRGGRTLDGETPEPFPVPDGFRLIGARATAFEVSEAGTVENCIDGAGGKSDCLVLGRFVPGTARRTVSDVTDVWTDGDPNVLQALRQLWQ